MKRADLQKTIILNAKSMIERDADFARFAARILLTYIYEEVLDWDIVRDGVEQLKEAHRRGFKPYLKRAIEIDRVHPKLLDFDVEQDRGRRSIPPPTSTSITSECRRCMTAT